MYIVVIVLPSLYWWWHLITVITVTSNEYSGITYNFNYQILVYFKNTMGKNLVGWSRVIGVIMLGFADLSLDSADADPAV